MIIRVPVNVFVAESFFHEDILQRKRQSAQQTAILYRMDPVKAALLEFLIADDDFSSSSSDSSDWGSLEELCDSGLSDLEFDYLASEEADTCFRKHRKTDKAHHTTQLDDKAFFDNYRINRHLVEELAFKYKSSRFFNYQVGKHGKLDAYDELLLFLWFVGHNATLREASQNFNLAVSTCNRVLRRVAAFLRSIFEIIKCPDEDDMVESSLYFRGKGLPLVIGAINLTHIEIDKPPLGWAVYRNVAKKFSVQVICDHKKRIIHMYAGAPGSETVTEVFEGSGLSDGLQDACGDFCILGDDGYPCLRNLLAPYRCDGDLTSEQEGYNQLLNVGKSLVEDCFAQMRKKFPQLNHCRIRAPEDINNFITACCVLYNLSLDDDFLAEVAAEHPDHNSHYFLTNADSEGRQFDAALTDTQEGVEYRDNLVAALNSRRRLTE